MRLKIQVIYIDCFYLKQFEFLSITPTLFTFCLPFETHEVVNESENPHWLFTPLSSRLENPIGSSSHLFMIISAAKLMLPFSLLGVTALLLCVTVLLLCVTTSFVLVQFSLRMVNAQLLKLPTHLPRLQIRLLRHHIAIAPPAAAIAILEVEIALPKHAFAAPDFSFCNTFPLHCFSCHRDCHFSAGFTNGFTVPYFTS